MEITVSFLGIHKLEPDIYIGFSLILHLQREQCELFVLFKMDFLKLENWQIWTKKEIWNCGWRNAWSFENSQPFSNKWSLFISVLLQYSICVLQVKTTFGRHMQFSTNYEPKTFLYNVLDNSESWILCQHSARHFIMSWKYQKPVKISDKFLGVCVDSQI